MATTITGRIVLREAQDTGYKMWLGRLLNKLVREHIMPYLDVKFETDDAGNGPGNVLLLDQDGYVPLENLSGIDAENLANGAVTNDKIAGGAVTEAKLATAAVTIDKIATNAVSGSKIAPNAVATPKIADDAVDDTKVGNRVPQFYRRQGGSGSNWSTPGSTYYTPGFVRIQAGSKQCDSSGSVNVTFPVAFSAPPIVFVQSARASQQTASVSQSTISATGFTAHVVNHYASDTEPHVSGDAQDIVFWLAIGAE